MIVSGKPAESNDQGLARGDRERPLNETQLPHFRGVRVALMQRLQPLLGVTGRDDEATSLARVLILSTESRHHQEFLSFSEEALISACIRRRVAENVPLGEGISRGRSTWPASPLLRRLFS